MEKPYKTLDRETILSIAMIFFSAEFLNLEYGKQTKTLYANLPASERVLICMQTLLRNIQFLIFWMGTFI